MSIADTDRKIMLEVQSEGEIISSVVEMHDRGAYLQLFPSSRLPYIASAGPITSSV